MALLHGKRPHYPLIVISDAHLGMRNTNAALLAEFLQTVRCDTLVINGDFIDGLRLKARRRERVFPEAEKRVLDSLSRMAAEGTDIHYVPGNHDAELRDQSLLGRTVMGLHFSDPLVYADKRGRQYLFIHGDRFKPPLQGPRKEKAALRAIDALAALNKAVDSAAHGLARRHFSIAAAGRRAQERMTRINEKFAKAALGHIAGQGFDGVICGHIHMPAVKHTKDGFYGNAGDWVDSATALAMKDDGSWEIIHWHERRKELGLTGRPKARHHNPDAAHRPQTELMVDAIREIWPPKGKSGGPQP